MKIVVLAALTLLVGTQGSGQELDWQKAKNWKIYSINEFAVFDFPTDTLKYFNAVSLSDDTIRNFLVNVKNISTEESIVWMGLYFLTCNLLNDQVRKVEVSVYGGFFYDELTKTYYELPEEIRARWLNYLSINFKKTGK